jgi:hypothetical protein
MLSQLMHVQTAGSHLPPDPLQSQYPARHLMVGKDKNDDEHQNIGELVSSYQTHNTKTLTCSSGKNNHHQPSSSLSFERCEASFPKCL